MKKNTKNFLYTIIFAIIGGFHRRWYGGGFGKAGMITRFWKYLALAVVVCAMYFARGLFDWQNLRMYAVVAALALHWARTHHDYYFVYSTAPDEGRIRWIDWVLRILYGENGYFNFKGNVTGLFLRYTATACVVCVALPDWRFVFAGVLTTLSYVVTGRMKYSTNWAEWLAGALNFGLLYVCL